MDASSPLQEIDREISNFQLQLSLLPRSHPLRPTLALILAATHLHRYTRSNDKQDLEKSIPHFAYTILYPFNFSIQERPLRSAAFLSLTLALLLRSIDHRQPSDIEATIKYLRYCRDHLHGIVDSDTGSGHITYYLVQALSLQVESGFHDALANIVEMTALCRELLASDNLEGSPTYAVKLWLKALGNNVGLKDQPLECVIICLREVNARLPDLHHASLTLAHSLSIRFRQTRSRGDYEEAMAILDKLTRSYSSRHPPDTSIRLAPVISLILTGSRLLYTLNPDSLEELIFRLRAVLSILSPEDPFYLKCNQFLALSERRRTDEFGVTSGLPEAHFCDPEDIGPPSFLSLLASSTHSNAVKSLPSDRTIKGQQLEMTIAMTQLTDLVDIEEAIKYCRLTLPSLDPTTVTAYLLTTTLGDLLFSAFKCTENAENLNASIDVFRDALEMPAAPLKIYPIQSLIRSLHSRFRLSNDRKDSDEIIKLLSIAVADKNAPVPARLICSFEWIMVSRALWHTSLPTAFDIAMSLMQESLVYAPTLEIQHFRLATMDHYHKNLPSDYAAYQVGMGLPKEAIETLERGRGLLWSEMRGFRTPLDRLRLLDMQLADNFEALNRDLELLTTSGPPRAWRNEDKVEGSERMHPFGRLVVEHRKLAEERDNLILKIRTLPGFDRFLMAPSFDTLRSAAALGPVIIINHCEFRSDILILFHDSPPSLITTADNFYHYANELKDQLLAARKEGLSSKAFDDALRSVLKCLYDLVGRPVIEVLRKSKVPEQSRVWWCPTSVFCSLPLHAMGSFPSDDGAMVYFSDVYITSYTPTLSALIESRRPGARAFSRPSLLLVAQPDESLPGGIGTARGR